MWPKWNHCPKVDGVSVVWTERVNSECLVLIDCCGSAHFPITLPACLYVDCTAVTERVGSEAIAPSEYTQSEYHYPFKVQTRHPSTTTAAQGKSSTASSHNPSSVSTSQQFSTGTLVSVSRVSWRLTTDLVCFSKDTRLEFKFILVSLVYYFIYSRLRVNIIIKISIFFSFPLEYWIINKYLVYHHFYYHFFLIHSPALHFSVATLARFGRHKAQLTEATLHFTHCRINTQSTTTTHTTGERPTFKCNKIKRSTSVLTSDNSKLTTTTVPRIPSCLADPTPPSANQDSPRHQMATYHSSHSSCPLSSFLFLRVIPVVLFCFVQLTPSLLSHTISPSSVLHLLSKFNAVLCAD